MSTTYYAQIEATDDGAIWQALHPREAITDATSPEDAAEAIGGNQDLVPPGEGEWRVLVYADEDSNDPILTWYPPKAWSTQS